MRLAESIWSEVRRIVADLASAHYDELERDGRSGRLSAAELAEAVRKYGRTLVLLPDESRELVEVYPQAGEPARALLDVPLWTKEEGRSDLSLTLSVVEREGRYRVTMNDLHVL